MSMDIPPSDYVGPSPGGRPPKSFSKESYAFKPHTAVFSVPPIPPQPNDVPQFNSTMDQSFGHSERGMKASLQVAPSLMKIISIAEAATQPAPLGIPRRFLTPSILRPTPLVPLTGDPYLEQEFLLSYMPMSTPAPIEMIESFVQPAFGCPRFKFVPWGSKKNCGFGNLINDGSSLDCRLGETRGFSSQGYNCGKVEWQFYPETSYGWMQVGVGQRKFLLFNVAETHGFSRYNFEEGSVWLTHKIYVEKHIPVKLYMELDEQIGGTIVVMYNDMVMARMVGLPLYIYHVVLNADGPVVTGLEIPLENPLRAYNEEVQREADLGRSLGNIPSMTDTRSSNLEFRLRFRDKARDDTRKKVKAREEEYITRARKG